MQNFTTLIVEKVRKEKLFASQGGPIILAQIENEYGNINGPYGDDGKEYINWCAKLANSFGIGVPWIMCQQHDAPEPMVYICLNSKSTYVVLHRIVSLSFPRILFRQKTLQRMIFGYVAA